MPKYKPLLSKLTPYDVGVTISNKPEMCNCKPSLFTVTRVCGKDVTIADSAGREYELKTSMLCLHFDIAKGSKRTIAQLTANDMVRIIYRSGHSAGYGKATKESLIPLLSKLAIEDSNVAELIDATLDQDGSCRHKSCAKEKSGNFTFVELRNKPKWNICECGHASIAPFASCPSCGREAANVS